MLLSVNRCEDALLKRLILHQTKDAALLDGGSSTSDLCVDRLPCKVLWYSTVFKEYSFLMFEGSSCQIFSGHKSNIGNHYYFVMMLAKDP